VNPEKIIHYNPKYLQLSATIIHSKAILFEIFFVDYYDRNIVSKEYISTPEIPFWPMPPSPP